VSETPDLRRIPVEAIREAARRAVAQTSLRAVARAIPMSPMGLQHFINGTSPYRGTLRKLTAWYVNRTGSRGEFSEETVRAALAILLDGIADERQPAARVQLLSLLVQQHEKAGTEAPAWLLAMLEGERGG
jgi:hypothetical protein